MNAVPTTTQRRNNTPQRNAMVSNSRGRYDRYSAYSHNSSPAAYDYRTAYPNYRELETPRVRPETVQSDRKKSVQETKKVSINSRAGAFKLFLKIACVFTLCFLMIYRYTVILESNNKITELTKQLAELEAQNQAISTKIERSLELGPLEEYATGELGMVRPDNSQIFYIDMQLGDATQSETQGDVEGNNALRGTPGALVHAIRVLK